MVNKLNKWPQLLVIWFCHSGGRSGTKDLVKIPSLISPLLSPTLKTIKSLPSSPRHHSYVGHIPMAVDHSKRELHITIMFPK